MSPNRRRLAIFLIIDAIVVIALVAWWFSRTAPTPAAPAPATPPPAAAAATTAPAAETPGTPVADVALPRLPAGLAECHGTWAGQPFWLRLLAPDPALGDKRRVLVQYTPPAQAEVDQALIHDCPELVLDAHLRIIEWDNRDGATGVMQGDPGYRVVREIHPTGTEEFQIKTRTIKREAAWDLRLAPLLVVLSQAEPSAWRVPVVDFWGPRAGERLDASGAGAQLTIAGTSLTIERDAQGRVMALRSADGQALLQVTAWR